MKNRSATLPHILILIISLPLILGGLTMKINEKDRCVWAVSGNRIPAVCAFRLCFGIDCPGCGMTRCFVSMAHGQVLKAVRYHPWGVAFYLFLCAQIPFRLYQIYRIKTGQEPLYIRYWLEGLTLFLILYFIQWFLRLGGFC